MRLQKIQNMKKSSANLDKGNKNMWQPILLGSGMMVGSISMLFRFYKTKEKSALTACAILFAANLPRWPFYLPREAGLVLMSTILAACSGFQFLRAKERYITVCSFLFFVLSIVMAILALNRLLG